MPIIRLDPDSPMGRELQQLQTIFYAIVAVPLLLFLMMYLDANQPGYRPFLSVGEAVALHIGVWLVVLVLAILVLRNYRSKNRSLAEGQGAGAAALPLQEKFRAYKRHSMQLHLILGFLMLLPIAAIWATGLLFYSIMFLLLIILIASVRPTVEHFISSVRLSKEEQALLSNAA
ncbi:hypothetical protein [Cesiribacter andamanensis]|uniref:Uncharacterized protein n=1 Tax=Cesiribacter andamanensis AMV16 TaxID=1279009 RepID=M7NQY3_9BACT|nr:hypothetical protein [Cesiribacter andamanensis]EMR04125.1 hypothetical protein ADICEAN_00748 [Cesiribacter andamanensis AMV16]